MTKSGKLTKLIAGTTPPRQAKMYTGLPSKPSKTVLQYKTGMLKDNETYGVRDPKGIGGKTVREHLTDKKRYHSWKRDSDDRIYEDFQGNQGTVSKYRNKYVTPISKPTGDSGKGHVNNFPDYRRGSGRRLA